MRMDSKVVLMAGGAGGIGSATSRRLGAEGAKVVVGDLNEEAAAEVAADIVAAGGTAVSVGMDVGDEGSVAAAIKAALDAYGGIDGVHVNAADLSPGTVLQDSDALGLDLSVFDRTIRTGLRGHLLCTQLALPHLLGRGNGALVYTSSAAAFIGEPERPSYAMAKAGINALVRHVASKWGKDGIRANAVAPGLVVTPTIEKTMDERFLQYALAGTRSSRLGRPEDIAAMVAFLMSSDGEWVNGQIISVDGGAVLR